MLILSNVIIVLIFALLMFVLFTYLNILDFSKNASTAFVLTIIFFDLFFLTPSKLINELYSNREEYIKKLKKNGQLDGEEEKKLRNVFSSKRRIFIALYKSGSLSYGALMNNINNWYSAKPFKAKIKVEKSKLGLNRRKLESKYMNDLKRDFPRLKTS